MSDEPIIDLAYIARRQKQILTELGTMRDDAAVLLAVVMRIGGTLIDLLRENRATPAQHTRLANRVAALEKAPRATHHVFARTAGIRVPILDTATGVRYACIRPRYTSHCRIW
jgi:hypothetical protein